MIGAALARGCDALVTGEMDHHRQLEAARRGLGVVLLGHGETERPYLPVFAGRLSGELGGARVVVAEEPAVARGV
jgi:putative NIF3 family GTP cyclohydrolase 1 type 2